ncbi:hypothetical protein [Streptomyces capitiformicae]|uniref:Uncharacterized protein n=1 Tax=Streptomyces capitiformicae TaxID=2014920 RepID=A0A919GJL6_9ACTN|nr:hypothetical protein [Streptomyces capitiformicae]GHH85171.1 hypothetical protein GCM10017771_17050 [Streptomyces capitiformicae]
MKPEPGKLPTAADLNTGLTTLADRRHAAGLTAIGSTSGPYLGDDHPFDCDHRHRRRRRGPRPTTRIRDDFNSGDGLHVNDAGAKAIADAVDPSPLEL